MRALFVLTVLSAMAIGCDRRVAASRPDMSTEEGATAANSADAPDADNSAVNARDRDGSLPTPLDQGQGQSDIDITASIRRRVVEQPFSLNGQNVKIITQQGKVTLRGPVKDAAEKQQIEAIASEVAGPENVESLLEVERD